MATFMRGARLIELLQSLDPDGEMAVQIMPDGRLGVGQDPLHPSQAIDFGSEKAVALSQSSPRPAFETPGSDDASKRQGAYRFHIRGQEVRAGSLKEILRHALLAFERILPGTMEKLSQIKPRSKRIVARNRSDLFETSYLAHDFSERLNDEWWFGTNNSAQETRAWLERAANCTGLVWGQDCGANF